MNGLKAKTVTVRYHAILREERGVESEVVTTDATNPLELYAQLTAAHGFSLEAGRMRTAVDDRFADWSDTLTDGCTVVFIPPVAGG